MHDALSFSLFASAMEEFGPFPDSFSLAVAVSGGADSLALSLLLHQWVSEKGGTLTALTVDHRLRAESTEEAAQTHQWLAEKGITHQTLTWDHDLPPASNIQEEAREARYRLMTDYCKLHAISALCLAHHQDDQAETLLLRLFRGSGLYGLSGMPARGEYAGVTLLRPLLSFPKQSLIKYLEEKNQPWIEDPTNQKPCYTRNKIRLFMKKAAETLDMEPELLSRRIAASATHLGHARQLMEEEANKLLENHVFAALEGFLALDYAAFHAAPEEIALRALSRCLQTVRGTGDATRFSSLLALYHHLQQPFTNAGTAQKKPAKHSLHGCFISFPGKDKAKRLAIPGSYRKPLLITRTPADVSPPVAIGANDATLWDNRFRCRLRGPLPQQDSPYFIGALTHEELQQLCTLQPSLRSISLPKEIILTLPALKTIDSIRAIPHINYYQDRTSEACLDIEYAPFSPLKTNLFIAKRYEYA